MCNILLQVYDCKHTKPVCVTPCSYALATSYPNPSLQRSPSAASSVAPTPPTFPHLPNSPQPGKHSGGGLPSETSLETINYCAFWRPRYLPASNYPCLECYLRPEWRLVRERWIEDYRKFHPGTPREHLERLSGVRLIPERMGLVNVAAGPTSLGGGEASRSSTGSEEGRGQEETKTGEGAGDQRQS